jgi:hypothetical protein
LLILFFSFRKDWTCTSECHPSSSEGIDPSDWQWYCRHSFHCKSAKGVWTWRLQPSQGSQVLKR